MERFQYAENTRAMRNAIERDPVEAAYMALASLSQSDREAAIERFNATYRDVSSVPRLSWEAQS